MRKLLVPQTRNKLGDSSFSDADLRLWNDRPPGLRWLWLSFDSFRQSLKSYFTATEVLSDSTEFINAIQMNLSIYLSMCVHCAKTENYWAETDDNWPSICLMANHRSGHISITSDLWPCDLFSYFWIKNLKLENNQSYYVLSLVHTIKLRLGRQRQVWFIP